MQSEIGLSGWQFRVADSGENGGILTGGRVNIPRALVFATYSDPSTDPPTGFLSTPTNSRVAGTNGTVVVDDSVAEDFTADTLIVNDWFGVNE